MSDKSVTSTQDDLELQAATVKNNDDWTTLLGLMSGSAPADDEGGGAASLGGDFDKLCNGAMYFARLRIGR